MAFVLLRAESIERSSLVSGFCGWSAITDMPFCTAGRAAIASIQRLRFGRVFNCSGCARSAATIHG
jgi:hypothetical protein